MTILSLSIFLPDERPIRAVSGTKAAIVALLSKEYLHKAGVVPDAYPLYLDCGFERIESLFKPQAATEGAG